MMSTREPLLKGKAQHCWFPCTNLFRSAAFDIANLIYIFTKQPTLEMNCTEPSPSVSVPWCAHSFLFKEENICKHNGRRHFFLGHVVLMI